MGKWIHRISLLDEDNRTALCANCGPVKIWRKGKQWRCCFSMSAYKRSHSGLLRTEAAEMRKNKVCEICGQRMTRMAVDHCHKTKQVRGVLCVKCNSGIGLLGDSIQLLKSAITYLTKYEKKRQPNQAA